MICNKPWFQEIKTRCLKLAVGLSSFKHAEEAKRIIKERAVVETELQAKELLDKEQQAKELLDKEQQANLWKTHTDHRDK